MLSLEQHLQSFAFTIFKKDEKNFENLEILHDWSHNFAPWHNNNTYGV